MTAYSDRDPTKFTQKKLDKRGPVLLIQFYYPPVKAVASGSRIEKVRMY
jgi:hypothetical protein